MNKAYIQVRTAFGEIHRKRVDAISVVIPGFEFLKLFIYQHDGRHALGDTESRLLEWDSDSLKGKYIVSHRGSGAFLLRPFDNPEEAVYEVTQKCQALGKVKVREAFRVALVKLAGEK